MTEAVGTSATSTDPWDQKCRRDLDVDRAFESGLLVKEVVIVTIIVVLVVLRELLL